MTRNAPPFKNTPALDSLPEDALQAMPTAAEAVAQPLPPRRRGGGKGILFAGVAGACVLGAGLGLWARPGMSERRLALTPPPAPAPAADAPRGLQVVVDDHPPPVGTPMQVLLPADAAKPASSPANLMTLPTFRPTSRAVSHPIEPPILPPAAVQTASAETPAARPFANPRLAALLTAAIAAPKLLLTRLEAPKAAPALLAKADDDHAQARAAAHRLALAQAAEARAARVEAAKQAAAQKAAREEAAEERLAQAKAARQEAAQTRLAEAKAAQAKAAQVRLAKAEADRAVKADHLAKLALAKAQIQAQIQAQAQVQAKAQKSEAIRLAKAEAKGRSEARAEARADALAEAKEETQKEIRLASLVRTLKRALPHEAKPPPAPTRAAPVRTAQLDRRHAKADAKREAVMERASLKGRKAHAEAQSRARVVAPPPPPAPRPTGLMKVSARCAQRDPGEALVCADPNLGAADRQLTRAYQGARAAGVPDAQLQRQQQHWLAARASAAREAPWAVHDVYMARIAELNGQARDAHGDGY